MPDRTNVIISGIEENLGHSADYSFSNTTKKTAWILRIETPEDVTWKISSRNMEPDSSVILRLHYNPSAPGKYRREVKVFVSSNPEPITLSMSGTVTEINPNYPTECPDFSQSDIQSKMRVIWHAILSDHDSGEPLKNADVRLRNKQGAITTLKTDSFGVAENPVSIGYYTVIAEAPGYESTTVSGMINQTNWRSVFKLDRIEPIPQPLPVAQPAPIPVQSEGNQRAKSQEENPDFPLTAFKPNNLVFLIDISSSMSKRNRIDLVKQSMDVLIDMLRKDDKVGVLTYASDVKLLMEPSNIMDKRKLQSQIHSLEAYGFTSGGQGIMEAIELCRRGYLEDGNNEIIVMTDGDFDLKEKPEWIKRIRESARSGIRLTVIGIRNGEVATGSLQTLAGEGKGKYYRISNESDALLILKQEVKEASKRDKSR